MADVKVVAQISADTGNATANVGKLKKEINDVGTGSKKATNEASGSFDNLRKTIANTTPATKGLTSGIDSVTGAFNVLIKNPIIAVLAAIAGLVIALAQKFSKMEAVGDSLGKSFSKIGALINALMQNVLKPLIDTVVKIIDLFGDAAEWIGGRFGDSVAESVKRTGELTEALDDLNDAEENSAIARAESNRLLQEAREIAADANVPIKERIQKLKEAGEIEQKEFTNAVNIATTRAKLMLEQIALELGARDELVKSIRNGSIEQLKAARDEISSMKNVDKEKLKAIRDLIINAENTGAQLAKVNKKTEASISSLEKEEEAKREAARKEAAQKAKEAREREWNARLELEKKMQDELKRINIEGQKAIQDALSILNKQSRESELAALKQKYEADAAAALAAGFTTLKIREAYNLQRSEINAKYDKQEADAQKIADDAETKAREERQMKQVANLTNFYVQSFELQEAANKAKIELDKQLLEQQKAMQEEVAGLLQKASQVVGQQTAVGKGLAIAQALINTYTGATDALRAKSTLPSPFDVAAKVINVAAVLATGFKSVKAITAVQVPGGGGAGAGSPSVPAPVAPAPIPTSTSLNQSSINAVGNAAAGGINRNYVLDSDITNANERQRRLARAARIG